MVALRLGFRNGALRGFIVFLRGHGAPKGILHTPLPRSALPSYKIIPSFVSSDSRHGITRFPALALPVVAWFASFVEPCPHLPACDPSRQKRHGQGRRATFYFDALCFAQGHWLEGKPAQAILQLNRAFSAELSDDDPILETWPWPYAALEWILENSADGGHGFLGNPVRHFQHLATRMNGPRQEIRIAHAWRCFHIARRVLDGKGDFPLDGRQLAREGIFVPSGKSL